MEQIILEVAERGPVSWDSLARCAREANMPLEDWCQDALAAYVRMHERQIREEQAEVFTHGRYAAPERAPVPAWKAWLGERLQRWADRLLDDGTEG